MPEFLHLLPPDEARQLLFSHLPPPRPAFETVATVAALGYVTADDLRAPHPLPEFSRSAMDGYAVRARDTFGASESLPAYLNLVGEIPMGAAPSISLKEGQTASIHTGGMLPSGADAVVMLEHTQSSRQSEIEVLRAVAERENTIQAGEDVTEGQVVIPRGVRLRPAEIGGLMALGLTELRVAKKVSVGLISTGDEVISPTERPGSGQVRDVNSYSLGALATKAGGEPRLFGIVPDSSESLQRLAAKALMECDLLLITAGSSASQRDLTAEVIDSLGEPGILVHGINTRPGKPTILGVCNGKAVLGLPGNPVSALVNGYLFVVPLIERLLGMPEGRLRPSVHARLTVNLSSQAGREDWVPVRLLPSPSGSPTGMLREGAGGEVELKADPIFGKSNLIFTLAAADGLLRIPPDATGLSAGEIVNVRLL
jgi:molybdopterin molybdotransferase